jgi:GTP-binding protein
LRHVERTRALLHLVTIDPAEDRNPLDDYRALRAELMAFDPAFATRPEVIALTKADITEVREAYPKWKRIFEQELGRELWLISAATRDGIDDMINRLAHIVVEARKHPS